MVFLDALRIKVRDGGRVVNKSAYMTIGVDLDGSKHILGLWIAKQEGASFWAQVCANLSNRGVKDVFIVGCDGLKGLPEASRGNLAELYGENLYRAPDSCRELVGGLRGSPGCVRCVEKVYTAADESTAKADLEEFEAPELGEKYPRSVKVWRDA